jgi:hypothetical protein
MKLLKAILCLLVSSMPPYLYDVADEPAGSWNEVM